MQRALGRERDTLKLALTLARLNSDVEALPDAWSVARRFPDNPKVASPAGFEPLHEEVRVAGRKSALRLLKTCDDISQNLLERKSMGDYLRRCCPGIEEPSRNAKTFIDTTGLLIDSLPYAWQVVVAEVARARADADRVNRIRGMADTSLVSAAPSVVPLAGMP